MTPEELEAIKDRAEKSRMWESAGHLMSWCEQDRAALLAEVDRLRAFILELDGDPFHGLAAQTVLRGEE